jgi:hypothetical protein
LHFWSNLNYIQKCAPFLTKKWWFFIKFWWIFTSKMRFISNIIINIVKNWWFIMIFSQKCAPFLTISKSSKFDDFISRNALHFHKNRNLKTILWLLFSKSKIWKLILNNKKVIIRNNKKTK